MAKGQKIDELFIGLGLDLTQLDLDFATVDKTVAQTLTKLNSEKNNIKLKTDIDLAKLEGAGSEIDKIRVKEDALSKTLDIQRKRVAILAAEYQSAKEKSGADSTVASRIENSYLKEQKAAAQLEAELRKLAASRELDAKAAVTAAAFEAKTLTAKERVAQINSKAGSVINSVGNIAAGGGAGFAATSALSALGAPGLAVAGIGAAVYGMAELSKPAAQAGEAVYELQQKLHTTAAEASRLNMVFKMSGQDISSVVPAFMRLDKQMMQAGSSNTLLGQTLARYNVELKDSTGHLLPLNQQLAALAEGYQKATEAGEGEEFVTQALGARGAELIPILEHYNELMTEASKIKMSDMINPEEAHKLAESWRVMDLQASQLKLSLSAALIPAANEMVPQLTEALGNMTEAISQNKAGIKDFAVAFSSAAIDVGKAIAGMCQGVSELYGLLQKLGAPPVKDVATVAKHDTQRTIETIAAGVFGGIFGSALGPAGTIAGAALAAGAVGSASVADDKMSGRLQQWQLDDAMAGQQHSDPKNDQAIDDALKKAPVVPKEIQDRNRKLDEQIDDTQFALTHSPLETQLHNEETAIKEEAKEAGDAGADKAKAFELADLKIAKAEQDYAKAVRDANRQVSDSLFQLTHNDLQSAVHSAEEQAQTWREQGLNSNLITAELEAKKSKIYEQFENDTMSKINSIWKSSLQNKLDDIDRERRAWIQKGVDEVKATQWAEREKQVTMQQAAQQALKENKQYLDAVRSAMSGEGSYDEKLQQAKLNVLQLMRAKTGMGSEYITPDLMRAYSSAMSFANNNLVRGMETDPLARNADNNAIGVMRGTKMDFNITVGNVFSEDGEGMQKLRESITGGIIKGIEPYLGDSANSYGG